MKTPGISFVIPVYNMERYLPRVIQCLKAQTMPGFEAIFVNDGSRDNSLAICKRAVSEDPRFRVIDQPNKGVAKARNAALDAARGEYVCFLDPDDWVEPDMAQVLYEAAKKENADIVMFGIYNDYYDKNGNCVKTLIDGPALCGVYRGKPFQEHFEVCRWQRRECPALLLRLFYVAFMRQNPSCLVAIQKPLYHYTFARSASLSNSWHPERLQDNFYLSDAVWSVVEDWGLQDSEMHRKKACYCTVRDLQLGIKNVCSGPLSAKERTDWLQKTVKLPRVENAIKNTAVKSFHSRNDRIKLLLLKLHQYRAVIWLSSQRHR